MSARLPGVLFRLAVVAAVVLAMGSVVLALRNDVPRSAADPANAAQVADGRTVYSRHCASCHGAKLEGRMPAPPHDETGHTWHHPDAVLFGITKQGLTGTRYAPKGYQSDMPGFGGVLTDGEIWAVLAYIKSTWPPQAREYQLEVERQSRARQ